MNKILPSILISLGINFHVLSSMAAEPLQDIGAKDSLVSSEIDHHINCLMFCLFETKVKVGENSILRSKNPAEIALFLKSIKTLRKKLCFIQPKRLQDKLMRFGSKSNIKKDDVCNEPFFAILNHARDWQYTVSLSIDNAIIPNHIFDDMDQLNSLELIDPIIVADDGAADCLFKNLKTNKTLKSLSLEYPMLYTGMGKTHVKPYFDAINSLFGKDSMIDLAKALAMNKTLTSLNIQANLRDESFVILESVLKNHPSISLWSV